jgi:hypothetical protein
MLKTLTLSLSFALALGLCSVSKAGGLLHGDGYGMASGQCPTVSPQAPCPSAQCAPTYCAPARKCHLLEGMQGWGNRMNCCFNGLCARLKPRPRCYTYEWVLKKRRVWGCHGGGCGTPSCDTCGVYPSGQGGYSSPQAGYGTPQAGYTPTYGTGQIASSAGILSPASAPAPVGGDEAPPAPEVTPAPPAPAGPQSSLLFSTPSGN